MNRYDNSTTDMNDLFLDYFMNLAINRFSYENLPEGLTSEILEEQLIKKGKMLGYKEKTTGALVVLNCMGESDLNIYGRPTHYNTFALNGRIQDNHVSADDGVVLYNNPLGSDDFEYLEVMAKKISEVSQTQDVNLFQMNIPKIIVTDNNSKLSAKALIDAVKKFKLCVFAKNSLTQNISTSDVLDNTAPYLLDKLGDYKQSLMNEVLTRLGIENNPVEKRERLITDEVNANNSFTNINLDLMYDLRKKWCEDMNEKFGTNITVKKREINTEETHTSEDNKENI